MIAGEAWIDDRYRVEGLLGRGGAADVVRAHDTATGHAVAVKLLRADDDRSQARFRAEIEVLAQLDHPGVVRLLDAGWHEARPYLVLDLVDGPTLAGLLLDGPLGEERSVTIGEHLGAALAYAHGLGIVHRDLKPSNVLFEDPARPPRLADFGLARLADSTRVTATGTCVGTAAYLAPEQLEGRSGSAADVFSLGLVVIECLTGALCYPGTVAEAALARLHRAPIVPADLPGWLRHMLRTMTLRDPERRPPAAAVAEAFRTRSAAPLPAVSTTTVVPFGPRIDEERVATYAPEDEATATATAAAPVATAELVDVRARSSRTRWGAAAAAALVAVLAAGSLAAGLGSGAEPRGVATEAEATSPSTATPTTTSADPPSTSLAVQAVAAAAPTTTAPPPTATEPASPAPANGRGPHGGRKPPAPPKDHPEPHGPKDGQGHP